MPKCPMFGWLMLNSLFLKIITRPKFWKAPHDLPWVSLIPAVPARLAARVS